MTHNITAVSSNGPLSAEKPPVCKIQLLRHIKDAFEWANSSSEFKLELPAAHNPAENYRDAALIFGLLTVISLIVSLVFWPAIFVTFALFLTTLYCTDQCLDNKEQCKEEVRQQVCEQYYNKFFLNRRYLEPAQNYSCHQWDIIRDEPSSLID